MKSIIHPLDDHFEKSEVVLFLSIERIFLEKGYHPGQQVFSISHHQHIRAVIFPSTMICFDVSATEPLFDHLKHILAGCILTDMKLGNRLPSDSHIIASLEGNVKAAFSIDKACYVVIIHDPDLSC